MNEQEPSSIEQGQTDSINRLARAIDNLANAITLIAAAQAGDSDEGYEPQGYLHQRPE